MSEAVFLIYSANEGEPYYSINASSLGAAFSFTVGDLTCLKQKSN